MGGGQARCAAAPLRLRIETSLAAFCVHTIVVNAQYRLGALYRQNLVAAVDVPELA